MSPACYPAMVCMQTLREHFWLGPLAVKSCCNRFGAMLNTWSPLSADCFAIACRATVGRALELPRSNNLNVVLAHQTPDTAPLVVCGQTASGHRVLPGMKPALGNTHQTAHMAAGQRATILGNILKLHGF